MQASEEKSSSKTVGVVFTVPESLHLLVLHLQA